MYIPKFFASDDETLAREVAAGHAFGILMTLPGARGLDADISHLPMLWTGDRLIGHVARANPHGARFDGVSPSVAVFSGPHAYVSPNWYAHDGLVPTWNYAAVHLHGKPRAVEDEAGAVDILDTLVAAFENDTTGNWSTADLPDGALSRQDFFAQLHTSAPNEQPAVVVVVVSHPGMGEPQSLHRCLLPPRTPFRPHIEVLA